MLQQLYYRLPILQEHVTLQVRRKPDAQWRYLVG